MNDFTNGTYKVLSIKQDNVYLPIGCLTENSFEESVDMLDTTTRDNPNGWKTSRPVGQQYSISFSGLVTSDISSNGMITFQSLRYTKRQRTLVDWKIEDGSGNDDYGQAYISSLSEAANIDEFVSFSGSLVGYGEPNNVFDSTYYGYRDRVLAAGGTFEAEQCTKDFIETLIFGGTDFLIWCPLKVLRFYEFEWSGNFFFMNTAFF